MAELRTNDWWRILSNYEASDLVKARFKARHGRGINTGKAKEICASITQARNYMEAAQGADRNVRPLLIYYGVLGLSRGLTLFLSTSLRESGLAQAHGLSVVSWNEELAQPDGSVGSLKVVLNTNGTLSQLLSATRNRSFLRSGSAEPTFVPTYPSPEGTVELTVSDVCSRIPEIRNSYSRWDSEDRNLVFVFNQEKDKDGDLCFKINGAYSETELQSIIGDSVAVKGTTGILTTISFPKSTRIFWSDAETILGIGNLVIMKPFQAGIMLSKIVLTFVTAYSLGMLVRYYPSRWAEILTNQSHSASLPTLLAAMDYVAEEFPKMAVRFFEEQASPPQAP